MTLANHLPNTSDDDEDAIRWVTVDAQRGELPATCWIRAFSTSGPGGPVGHAETGHGLGLITVAHDGIWVANRGNHRGPGCDLGGRVKWVALADLARCAWSGRGRTARPWSNRRRRRRKPDLGAAQTLHSVSCKAQQLTSTVALPGQPRAITAEGRTAWVACGHGRRNEGTIERVDLGSGEITLWRATKWPVGNLALAQGKLLAAMSLTSGHPSGLYQGNVLQGLEMGGGDWGGGSGGS